MNAPTHVTTMEVLLLQAADRGRGPILFGDSLTRARELARPFMIGDGFPDIYLEFPLVGDPFLDMTLLYNALEPGSSVDSPAAAGTEGMLDWFAKMRQDYNDICCGFELDTKQANLPAAAIHFQPRRHTELVEPFCNVVGEPERARLYLELSERMPEGWPLSFFGMFRGRPGSPLRVCGYLSANEQAACGQDPNRLRKVFEQVGFSAHTDTMLEQASTLLGIADLSTDFQFDIFPDGSLGDTFAIDAQFGIEQPEAVRANFTNGVGAHVMRLFENWGIADRRWRHGAEAAFARAIPIELPDSKLGRYAFTLMPQWVKARWTNGMPQPSKLYLLAHGGLLENDKKNDEPPETK